MQSSHRVVMAMMAAILLAALSGCKHTYELDITVDPNGGGNRTVRFAADLSPTDQDSLSLVRVQEIFRLDPALGWKVVSIDSTDKSGTMEPETYHFARVALVRDGSSWSSQSGDLLILAAPPGGRYDDVQFSSQIAVEVERIDDTRQYTYRERLSWTGLREALVAFLSTAIEKRFAELFPKADRNQQAEVRGIVAGHLALYLSSFDEEGEICIDDDTIAHSIVSSLTGIVRRFEPEVEEEELFELVRPAFDDSPSELDRFVEENLPGVEEAWQTTLRFRLKMPGTILETNADQVEEGFAEWETEPLAALSRPIEIFARSELTNGSSSP